MKLIHPGMFRLLIGLLLFCGGLSAQEPSESNWAEWYRPVEDSVFTTSHGNNHDSILFHDPTLKYPYHMIVSHTRDAAHLWRAKRFSWNSDDWELVSDNYKIARHYEFDDGVKVGDTYYVFEAGKVYTLSESLENGSGRWKTAGEFPVRQCEDIGVYYEDGMFHIFGEHGDYPNGPDGISLSHFESRTGLGDWRLVNTKAVDPNPDGGNKYGVGDPTIAKIGGRYYLYCDRESKESPYKITAWQSGDLRKPFKYMGEAIKPRAGQTKHWDNHRIQDGDILYVPELARFVMSCNLMDLDGVPGGDFPTLGKKKTRVIGFFYSKKMTIQNRKHRP